MMGVVVPEMQRRVNSLYVEMLNALVEALQALPLLITKELERWGVSQFIAPRWHTERYQRDNEVSSLLVERVEAMVRAYESYSATSLRESSVRVWGEIRRITATGDESLTPHGVAWVVLIHQIEEILISAFGEA